MSESMIEQPVNTVSNVAIDKDYLLGALKTFDGAILEKKYSFKVDGTNITVPAPEGNNGTIFQYIGEEPNDNGLQYGYFYKIVYKEEDQLDTYRATDSEGKSYTVYLNGDHLWNNSVEAPTDFYPINGAKFNLTDDNSKLTYNGLDYTKDEDSVTGVLLGYLAISTQPDAAEPITYDIEKLDGNNDLNIKYQLFKTELGVRSAVEGSLIEIPKNKLLTNAVLISGIHKGEESLSQDPNGYYSPDYEGGTEPLPDFNNPDSTEGDTRVYDTYIMLTFDISDYEGESDLSYIYISTKSLIDETDFGYGLTADNGVFNVTTQVTKLPGSDIADESERQTYLSTYNGNDNNPKVVQLTKNGLFYELKSTIVEGVTTYEWQYIAPVIFNKENIAFDVSKFQIGAFTETTYEHPTTDAGSEEATDPSGD